MWKVFQPFLKWLRKPKYEVRQYTGSYWQRQEDANNDGADCFLALHMNSAGKDANYALAVVGTNASKASKAWARDFVQLISTAFRVPVWNDYGVCVGGMEGRGNSQIVHTKMPAMLGEPLFCSNPSHAELLRNKDGRAAIAACYADSIRQHFPPLTIPGRRRLIAVSVGHAGKPAPHQYDCGAPVFARPGQSELWESEICQDIADRIKRLLETI